MIRLAPRTCTHEQGGFLSPLVLEAAMEVLAVILAVELVYWLFDGLTLQEA